MCYFVYPWNPSMTDRRLDVQFASPRVCCWHLVKDTLWFTSCFECVYARAASGKYVSHGLCQVPVEPSANKSSYSGWLKHQNLIPREGWAGFCHKLLIVVVNTSARQVVLIFWDLSLFQLSTEADLNIPDTTAASSSSDKQSWVFITILMLWLHCYRQRLTPLITPYHHQPWPLKILL